MTLTRTIKMKTGVALLTSKLNYSIQVKKVLRHVSQDVISCEEFKNPKQRNYVGQIGASQRNNTNQIGSQNTNQIGSQNTNQIGSQNYKKKLASDENSYYTNHIPFSSSHFR